MEGRSGPGTASGDGESDKGRWKIHAVVTLLQAGPAKRASSTPRG